MKVLENINNIYLDKIRYNGKYSPFSNNYDSSLNSKLFEDAKLNGADENTLSIISSGDFFHIVCHKNLLDELNELYSSAKLPKNKLRDLFIAVTNNQEILVRNKKREFFNQTNQLTAFDINNAVIIRKDSPNHPQGFTANSEILIEHINELFRYLYFVDENSNDTKNQMLNEEDVYLQLMKFQHITNKYHGIKNHYESCLYYNGRIEIRDDSTIFFDSCINDLTLYERISMSIIGNQRMGRQHQYQHRCINTPNIQLYIVQNFGNRVIDKVIIQGGYIKYTLRKREPKDYACYVDSAVATMDYYPFYSEKPLDLFNNITISELVKLHVELCYLINEVYNGKFPSTIVSNLKQLSSSFAPKIKHSVLKSFLSQVTKVSDSKIDAFLNIITPANENKLNLYATNLLKMNDYYYFPLFPVSHPNYYFLIDYWLERAGINLEIRGKDFEKYVKKSLNSIKQKEANVFRVIDKNNFIIDENNKEEIDLIIETKNTIIIAEVKCTKYPMYERDFYKILSDIIGKKAAVQVKRKSDFIVEHESDFKEIYSVKGKKIVKVIILNFPVFTGMIVDDIPVIDFPNFLSYFQSSGMSAVGYNNESIEKNRIATYYSNENEFCDNLDSFLNNNPLVKYYKEQFKKSDSHYVIPDLSKIIYSEIIPLNTESFLFE